MSEKFDSYDKNHDYLETRIIEAISLIVVGVIFLMNTTGVLPWSIWLNFLRFWPLFIVTAGIGIIFRGSRLLKFIGSFINFLIFIAILSLAIFQQGNQNFNFFNSFSVCWKTSSSDARESSRSIILRISL
jgi:hypothetical protein